VDDTKKRGGHRLRGTGRADAFRAGVFFIPQAFVTNAGK
jgi:hypothetical protein